MVKFSESQLAFIDEYGDTNIDIDKSDVSKFYILVSVIIDKNRRNEVEKQADIISKNFFSGGEMKSRNIANNDERRIRILSEFANIDFKFYAIVIDKEKIYPDSGLGYKRSFYKYLNRLLYNKLFSSFKEIDVYADEYGYDEFMEGFHKYLNKKLPLNLFPESSFEFVSSDKQPLIQIADIIAGTLARIYDPLKKSARHDEFLKLLNNKILGINAWPPFRHHFNDILWEKEENKNDTLIRDISVNSVRLFIENYRDKKDEESLEQVKILEYIYLMFTIESDKYISTQKIMEVVNYGKRNPISKRYLRSRIIAQLRDKGVIISSSKFGYKIPSSVQDLTAFVNHTFNQINPMLERLQIARKQIKLSSRGEIDIQDFDEYKSFWKIVDSYKNYQ